MKILHNHKWVPSTVRYLSCDPLGLRSHGLHVTRLLALGICKPNPKRGFPFISENIQHFSSLLRMVLREFVREKIKSDFQVVKKTS